MTALNNGPIAQKTGRMSDHEVTAMSVATREASGAYIGKVTRPLAWSPTTSAKSCVWMVVKISTPLIQMAVVAAASR